MKSVLAQQLTALDAAIEGVAKAVEQNLHGIDGHSATPRLLKLQHQLAQARLHVMAERPLEPQEFSGLLRWITDWLPYPDRILVPLMARVEEVSRLSEE